MNGLTHMDRHVFDPRHTYVSIGLMVAVLVFLMGWAWKFSEANSKLNWVAEQVKPIPQIQQDVALLKQDVASIKERPVTIGPYPPEPVEENISAPSSGVVASAGTNGLKAAPGFRIQLSKCHGTPGQLTVKKSQPFVLDNRDSNSVTVRVAGSSYRLGAYKTVTTAISRVGTHQVTCNGGGAATLIVAR